VKFLDHLARSRIDHANDRGHVSSIRPAIGQAIGHEQAASILCDVRREWLPLYGNPAQLLPRGQINDAHVVVEPVADVKVFAVWAKNRGHRSVTSRNGIGDFPLHQIDHADLALRGRAGDV